MGHTFALDIRPKAGANGGATTGTWLRGAATEAFDSRGGGRFSLMDVTLPTTNAPIRIRMVKS